MATATVLVYTARFSISWCHGSAHSSFESWCVYGSQWHQDPYIVYMSPSIGNCQLALWAWCLQLLVFFILLDSAYVASRLCYFFSHTVLLILILKLGTTVLLYYYIITRLSTIEYCYYCYYYCLLCLIGVTGFFNPTFPMDHKGYQVSIEIVLKNVYA